MFKYTPMNKKKTKKRHILLIFPRIVSVFFVVLIGCGKQKTLNFKDCGLEVYRFDQEFFNIKKDSFDINFYYHLFSQRIYFMGTNFREKNFFRIFLYFKKYFNCSININLFYID